jgi:soluble lytic murein transglycosylase-like protein
MCAMFLFEPYSHANTQAQNAKLLTQTALSMGLEPAVVLAFAMKESKMRDTAFNHNPNGKGEDDIRQSHGLLQITFATAKAFGAKTISDLYDAKKNALYGCRFIKYLMVKYSKKYSLAQVAMMYNLGEGRFFKGKTAIKYSQEWLSYYRMYSDQSKKLNSKPSSSVLLERELCPTVLSMDVKERPEKKDYATTIICYYGGMVA